MIFTHSLLFTDQPHPIMGG